MDPNQHQQIPVSLIYTTLSRQAKRAQTTAEKGCIYGLADALGTAIANENPGPGFAKAEFLKACGVQPEWGTAVAA